MAKMLVVAAALIMVLKVVAAEVHTVGDDNGWGIPPSPDFYTSWAAKQKFMTGDTLLFNFNSFSHSVVEVPEDGYSNCDASNPLNSIIMDGPVEITLKEPGKHFFICNIGTHCKSGQKLSIVVGGTAISSPAPATATASAPAPALAADIAPAPSPSSPSTSGSSPAMAYTSALFSVSFIAFVMALLH